MLKLSSKKVALSLFLCFSIITAGFSLSSIEVSAAAPYCNITRVFTYQEAGYYLFHQSGMVVADDGTILAYTQGRVGSESDGAPVDIILKRSMDKGATWGAMQVVWDNSEAVTKWGNSSFVVDNYDGKIYSFAEVPCGKEVWYKTSMDNGATWSSATQIDPDKFSGTGRNANGNAPHNGICTNSGRIMIPIQCRNAELAAWGYSEKDFALGVLYSDDHGGTWQLSSLATTGNYEGCEFSVIQSPNGNLYMNARPTTGITRVYAISTDNGSTWSSMAPISDLVMFPTACGTAADSSYMYFAAPDMIQERNNGFVWYSTNNGNSWTKGPLLSAGGFGNTGLGILSNGTIGCIFQALYKNKYAQFCVDFANFTSDWVTSGSSTIVNDDTGITYSGTWGDNNSATGCYNTDNHYSNTPADYAEYTFVGNSITWYGSKAADHGKVDIYIDNIYQTTTDTYVSGSSQKQQALYTKTGLGNGLHTIKIVLRSDKNASSSNYYQDVDFLTYTRVPVNDDESGIMYSGTWGDNNNATGCYNTDNHYSNTPTSYIEYTFTGTGITWYGSKAADHGKAEVYIDNVFQTRVDTFYSGSPSLKQQALYTKTGLSSGSHTIKIVVTNIKSIYSVDYYQDVDYFMYY